MAYGPAYRISFGPPLAGVVRSLVLINAAVFVWQLLAGWMGGYEIIAIFGLTPALVLGKLFVWQLVTYLFLHADFFHIFFNMFALWMFGSELERYWGSRAFLRYFFVTGVGAGLLSVAVDPWSTVPTIGASGAVYGILLAYALMFPDRYIYLYFLFPVKVKYFVAVIGAIAFFSALGSPGSTISHVAHLGGMLFGWLYLRGWLRWDRLRYAYHQWRMRRLRSRFKVYEQKRRRDDQDYWIQ
ncbi:MAG: hypothetical protein Kow00109_26070 [Acidobacteriota bacterium]